MITLIVLMCIMAGAGSGKSIYISQKLIIKALRSQRKILICRRTAATLRDTVYAEYKSTLQRYQILEYCTVRDYDKRITLPNGSELIFKGLDDEGKLLSLSGFTDIHIEECSEVPRNIFRQLNTRLRANVPNLEIYLSFNPTSKNSWLYEFVNNPPQNTYILQTTYKDNKYLNKYAVAAYEEQGRIDPEWAQVFLRGEFGVAPAGLVYKNVVIGSFNQEDILSNKDMDIRIGIDTGWVDPTAIVVAAYNHKTKDCYILKELYKTNLTLENLYKEMELMQIANTRRPIYVDSADRKTIDYLKSNRVMVKSAIKGAGSIEAGIAFLKGYTIHVPHTCPNIINELQSYSYFKNPKTGEYEDNKYDGPDHALDALRYSICDLYSKRPVTVSSKSKYGF